jgi:putative tricarboxylic transport membrane protein
VRTDLVVAAVTGALAIAYLIGAHSIPTLAIGDPLGPRAFPILIGAGLLFSAGLLVVETLRAKKAGGPGEAEASVPPFGRNLLITIGAIIALVLAFEPIGYVLSVLAFLLFLTMLLNRAHPVVNVVASVVLAFGSELLFDSLLGVRLPVGLFGF